MTDTNAPCPLCWSTKLIQFEFWAYDDPCGEFVPHLRCDKCGCRALASVWNQRRDPWRPIEALPHDHTIVVDIWSDAYQERYTDCVLMYPTYGKREYAWCYQASYDCDGPVHEPVPLPSRWMPVPVPEGDGDA